jgi:hypothetical protein
MYWPDYTASLPPSSIVTVINTASVLPKWTKALNSLVIERGLDRFLAVRAGQP